MSEADQEQAVLVERRGRVMVITLNRPEAMNAINGALSHGLLAAVRELDGDPNLPAGVITGAGRGFCSGADLSGGGPAEAVSQNERLDEFGWVGRQAMSIYELDKPVIAAVNGVAAGAGMSLALACDIRVGSENSRFKSVFIERNLSPDSGLSFFLPRIVGLSRAADLVYTSRPVDAEEAYRLGLLDRLVEHDKLLDTALELAAAMAQWPPLALRSSKRVLQQNLEVPLRDALKNELKGLSFAGRARNDAKESQAAFFEKRKPSYTGT